MQVMKGALPALLLVAPAGPVHSAAFVLGDSLGVGVAQVSHLKGLARISVHIRGPRALEQFARTPSNSTVFLVLGTNDANGSIKSLDKSIDNIVNAAERKNITLVWMGPPCVRQPWDSRSKELDVILRKRFAGTSVRYVSMRDSDMCTGAFHERDGVHLKTKGYVQVWERGRCEGGSAGAAADPAAFGFPRAAARAAADPEHT